MFDFESIAEDIDQAIASIPPVNWSAVAGGLVGLVICLWLLRSGGVVRWLVGLAGLTTLAWWAWQAIFPEGEGMGAMLGD